MLPALAAGASVLGGVSGAIGELRQGNEALRQTSIQADLILRNLEVNQVLTRERIRDLNVQFQALEGTQVAVSGKSGVKAGTGSSLLANVSLRRERRLSTLRQEYLLDVQETYAPFQADQVRRSGQVAKEQSYLNAASRLLGGFGQAMGALK